jgi:SOS response regulatory protein OraA/RecX
VDEIYLYALKLLRARDYSVADIRRRLETKFGSVPQTVIDQLLKKNFLNDRRFTENYTARRKRRGSAQVREELIARGINTDLIDEIVTSTDWPSLQEAAAAKMKDWKLRAPLQPSDAARLFRALLRLGYDEGAILEEIEHFNEQ